MVEEEEGFKVKGERLKLKGFKAGIASFPNFLLP
jgi:hypothetical protein